MSLPYHTDDELAIKLYLSNLVTESPQEEFETIVRNMDLFDLVIQRFNRSKRVPIKIPFGNYLLSIACIRGNEEKVNFLLSLGIIDINLNRKTFDGSTTLDGSPMPFAYETPVVISDGPIHDTIYYIRDNNDREKRSRIVLNLINHGAIFDIPEINTLRAKMFSEQFIAECITARNNFTSKERHWRPRSAFVTYREGSLPTTDEVMDDDHIQRYLHNYFVAREIATYINPDSPLAIGGNKRRNKMQKKTRKGVSKKSKNTRKH